MNPLFIFLLFFVGAPLFELYVLIEVGSEIGALSTISLSVLTAIIGGLLVRMQGFSVLIRAQGQMAQQQVPAIEMMEGAMLIVVGLALMLPGFVTDTIGFLLLVPPIRRTVIIWVLKSRGIMRPGDTVNPAQSRNSTSGYIEGDYKREE